MLDFMRRALRARRNSAEQVNPGSESCNVNNEIGGTVMVRKVQTKLNKLCSVSLVLVGWIAFVSGVYIEGPLVLKLMLLSVARVLP